MTKIKQIVLDSIVKLLPKAVCNTVEKKLKVAYRFVNLNSFSQEGEDLILQRCFSSKNIGFYIDVGAHHPRRFSNTNMFYLQGWRGINIDATPGSMEIFNKERPRDINLECAISGVDSELSYFIFNEPALNTFDGKRALKLQVENPQYRITEKVLLKTKTLTQILDIHLPAATNIDFLSIDAEGVDFEILKSLDFRKYSPSMILIEDLNGSLELIKESPVYLYMNSNGYELVSKSFNTLFFRFLNK